MTPAPLAAIPSTLLAPPTRGLVPADVLRDQLAAVQRLREAVRTASLAEAVDIAEKARMAAKFARVAQAAGELAVEAVKLECQALRRVGQLDPSVLKGERKKVAESFAAMSDQEFAVGVLVRAVASATSATAVYRSMRADERHASDAEQFWSAPESSRVSGDPLYRARGSRSDLALMCGGTDVALDLLAGVDDVLARIQALPYDSFDGEAAAVLLRLSGLAKTAALQLDDLGRHVTAPELAAEVSVPTLVRGGAS